MLPVYTLTLGSADFKNEKKIKIITTWFAFYVMITVMQTVCSQKSYTQAICMLIFIMLSVECKHIKRPLL